MSGRHRRPEPDPLPEVDLARRLTPGPVVPAQGAAVPGVGRPARHAGPSAPVAGPAAAAPGATVVVRRDRAAQRAARREAARRRNARFLAAGAGALVLLLVVGYLVLGRGGEDGAGTTNAGPPRQHTLLVQATGADGTAAASALVGVTPSEDTAAIVLVPSRLLVDVAGTGNLPFGETVTLPEPSAPSQALTDLLGVRVDDSWTLDPAALAALVDAVGGVEASVDVDVVAADGDGNESVVVQAGTQQLDGAAAAAYATYLAEDEPEQARLARFDDVLTGVIAALPEDPSGVGEALQAAGEGSSSTLDGAGLARRLGEVQAAQSADELVSDVLPVTEIDTGGGSTSYGIDLGQVAAMMRARFPGVLQKDAGGEVLRVLVENGVGTPGLVEAARTHLVDDGFRFVNGGNAAEFGFEESAVIIPDGTEKSVSRGQRVAASLGLPESSVTTSDRGQTVADVIVILGADFTPGKP
ncbi:MAG TPA: LytR C-terminal domain-containing protein [Actinomycetes bacterium]